MLDRNGKELQAGDIVTCYVHGTLTITTIIKLRPRKGEVVLRGGHYKHSTWVALIGGGISQKYTERHKFLDYNPEKPWQYDNSVISIMWEFRRELDQVYGASIPSEESRIWEEAWERGHAEGYDKVEEIYVALSRVGLDIRCDGW